MAKLPGGIAASETDVMLPGENVTNSGQKKETNPQEQANPNIPPTKKQSNKVAPNDNVTSKSPHGPQVKNNQPESGKELIEKYTAETEYFIYHNGKLCNRRPIAWIVTIAYLMCIYICFGLLLAGGVSILVKITKDAPEYYGETTFIGGIPGLGFEPRKRSRKTQQNVIKWNIKDPGSYAFYVRRLRRIMFEYAKKELIRSKFKIDCKKKVIPRVGGSPVKHFCKTDVTNTDDDYGYGRCALSKNTNFGYDIGAPCVMLRINKLFGYYPEPPVFDPAFNISLDLQSSKICQFTSNLTACCNDDRMLFYCSFMGKNSSAAVEHYPKIGYPYCFYPYNKQKGYMQPFVMIRLHNLTPKKKTGIKCRPIAPDLRESSIKLWFQIV